MTPSDPKYVASDQAVPSTPRVLVQAYQSRGLMEAPITIDMTGIDDDEADAGVDLSSSMSDGEKTKPEAKPRGRNNFITIDKTGSCDELSTSMSDGEKMQPEAKSRKRKRSTSSVGSVTEISEGKKDVFLLINYKYR